MSKRFLPTVLFVFIALAALFIFIPQQYKASFVLSATGHIVISEVQHTGSTAKDEFVELYNPTNNAVDLSGWRLTKKTSGGSQSNLVSSLSGTIPAYGYFLITHPNYTGATTADMQYSAPSNSLSDNNTAILYSDAGITIIDLVGMGTAGINETDPAINPSVGESIERKAHQLSTSVTMAIGGDDETNGNGYDSDNNANDFVLRTIPNPQNSQSPTENVSTPTPTPTSAAPPTPSSTPSPSTRPTLSDRIQDHFAKHAIRHQVICTTNYIERSLPRGGAILIPRLYCYRPPSTR